jgi:hypothetical protein
VTRDFGSQALVDERESISESDTVLRLLDRNADVETRYGGGFVQSIDGLSGGRADGRASDWFFYVDGIESPVGAAEYELGDGERVWWDYHDWTAAMRVPAVVGSWPEPFLHGFKEDQWPAEVRCVTFPGTCGRVAERLGAAGAMLAPTPESTELGPHEGSIAVLVGTWAHIRRDQEASLLDGGPEESGVFARFSGGRRALLTLLNQRAEVAGSLGRGAGLVAALRPGDGPPTWVVTGTDRAGVEAAVDLLDEDLADRFAVATDGAGEPIGVPVP